MFGALKFAPRYSCHNPYNYWGHTEWIEKCSQLAPEGGGIDIFKITLTAAAD